jgi:hypothetical protein
MSDYSRVNLFAGKLVGEEGGKIEKRLKNQRTFISLEPDLKGALLAARVLCNTLGRLPGSVALNSTNLTRKQIKTLNCAYKSTSGSALVIDENAEVDNLESIKVHIGTKYHKGVIRAVPEGYGGHIISSAEDISVKRPANPLGSIYTAATASTEIFKIATDLQEHKRASLFENFTFCPVAMSSDLSLAPSMPPSMVIDVAILGIGAIGSAIALILSELDMMGKILLIDNERFKKENLSTYSLGSLKTVKTEPWKVNIASQILGNYSVTSKVESIENVARLIDEGVLAWPSVVMSSLDSIGSRYAAQRIWPDHLIDPATGNTMIGIRAVSIKQPCLMCFLSKTSDNRSSVERLSDITGLSMDILRRGDDPLKTEDLQNLQIQQKNSLRAYVGQPICGLADMFGLTGSAEDYQPSIPFASQQAACLSVGRLIALKLGLRHDDNLIQYDVFRGPENATRQILKKDNTCYCSTHSKNIDIVRKLRSGT